MSRSDSGEPSTAIDAPSPDQTSEPRLETEDALLSPLERATAEKRLEVARLRRERMRLRAAREALGRGKPKKPRPAWMDEPDDDDEESDVGEAPVAKQAPNGSAEEQNPSEETTPVEETRAPLPPAEPQTNTVESARESTARKLRRSRLHGLLLRLVLLVVLPTVAAAVWYYRFSSDRYESVALITIYSAEAIDPTAAAGLGSLIGLGAGSNLVTDGLSVREYIFSRDMLRRLNDEHGFIAHYKDPTKDRLARLPADATFEEAYANFEDWVEVEVDPGSGVATLTVVAFSAEAAQRFAQAIIHYSEEMVNRLSDRARRDQVRFAEEEFKAAEERLGKARDELMAVQLERGEFNPEQAAMAQMQIRTSLESELAKARAELAQLQAVLTPDAPDVVGAKERIRSLSGQVALTSRKMVAGDEAQSLNKSASQFDSALVEKGFATTAYQAAMESLAMARMQAARKHRYLATISPPSLADTGTLPKRGWNVLTAFLCSFLAMGIGSLLVATVREHSQL